MSRLLVDDVTKTDARALLNVNKMATISDIVAPSNEYIYASGANELTVVEGCVIAVGGAGIFKTANTILTAANLDAGSAFAVGKDYYVYICDSRIDSADEKYVISLNSTYPTGWNATNSRKIGGFHYGRCRKVDSNLQPLNGSSVIFGTGWESAVNEIIFKLPDHTDEAVVAALDRLERKWGADMFKRVFKTITVDNGSEFADAEGLQRSIINEGEKRTKVYYCHPYSSWERGTNEVTNKMIRRKIPKGTNFDDRTEEEVESIENWINGYPRKIHGYHSAGELFEEEVKQLA